ncbi:tryptophan halogenase family protein [Aestuariibacter sp. A3R04]|uniref:tryptophan halogenase family protein n=1 Tax=Aestuariibacter sp. A3R04 TaxID=2841571 RepID=UPI001C0A1F56|nr:tryptophan halogenase family protein [Aestuariibacter sp. A3R04]MBU3021806.1 tryptophan 7-halogenase [Aestuariibacter sp. A3R04]
MTKNVIKDVVIVGGGTAGWISAAVIQRLLGATVSVNLIESEDIGTVGVGEATIPPITLLNNMLGIDEKAFIRETNATMKLAIRFENWRVNGEQYYHTFGAPGKSFAFCQFHHYFKRAQQLGLEDSLWDYDLNYLACEAGKFAHIASPDPIIEMPYAYHFDASLYARFLRKKCEQMGVTRTEGIITSVQQNADSGYIDSVTLKDGKKISGDLFVDCSGFRGLLIQQTLNTGYEDWSHWLPCDRAVAMPSERHEKTSPFTRSIAHTAGWQWRIPLQHRNGNGLVYSSHHYTDDQALDILSSNLETAPIGDPKYIHFRTGRRRKQWHKNVIAVGLSGGFLEPLESTSIHLIQSAVVRLVHLFPHDGIKQKQIEEYNKQSQMEFEQIRDFIILHYHVNERNDSQFWKDVRNMEVPESLMHKIELFTASGNLFRAQNDLFLESSWLQVLMGQGVKAGDYHPLANGMSEKKLFELMASIKKIKNEPVGKLASHDDFLREYCRLQRP